MNHDQYMLLVNSVCDIDAWSKMGTIPPDVRDKFQMVCSAFYMLAKDYEVAIEKAERAKEGGVTKRTPGPWIIEKHPDCDAYYIIGNHSEFGKTELAVIYGGDNPERRANLALMAVAPALLQELKDAELYAAHERGCPFREANCICGYEQWWQRKEAAIALAEPKEPHAE